VWRNVATKLGVRTNFTTSFHPQANGLVERFHRSLKAALRARLTRESWTFELPWVLLGVRSTPRDDANVSPAEVVFGAPLRLPSDLPTTSAPAIEEFVENLKEAMKRATPVPATHNNDKQKFYVPKDLLDCRHVWLRIDRVKKPLERPYAGPYEVVERLGKCFVLRLGERLEKVSVDRLKAVVSDGQIEEASPPRRGRPKKR